MASAGADRFGWLALLFALTAALAGVGLYYWSPKLLERLDLRGRDVAQELRPAIAPDPRVAIVAVDERSVRAFGRWPWSREVQARLLREAKAAGAAVLALDIVYPHPQDRRADRELAQALAAPPSAVVLGYFFRGTDEKSGEARAPDPERVEVIEADRLLGGVADRSGNLIRRDRVETSLPGLRAAADAGGFFNILHDDDGLIRKSPLVIGFRDGIYPSLALKSLSLLLEEPVGLKLAAFGVEEVMLGERVVPVDESGQLTLSFYGAGGTIPTYSALDVMERKLPPEALRDKLVFVGVTEVGISDLRATPVDAYFPGVEVHGVVASNILQGRYIVRDSRTVLMDLAMVVVLPFLLVYLLGRVHKTLWGAAILLLFLLAVGAAFYTLFVFGGYQVGFSYPLVSLASTYLLAEGYRNLVIEKRSRFVQRAFSTYVAPSLVQVIMKDPKRLQLGGEKRVITVLFSDIRGFTTLSEKLNPEQLVTLLNRYLGPMSDIVLEEQGTLDKYIGDAIMAEYNAPVDVPDHAARACRTALRMMDALAELNRDFERDFGLRLDIGIGLNTGEAVVGNMGTALRFDYTAIGDTVNLSSRLEGQNKTYGTHVIVTEVTRAAAGGEFLFRPLDAIRVKGKHRPVQIFELMNFAARASAGEQARAQEFTRALELYRIGRFNEATASFERQSRDNPDDAPAALYLRRCREYVQAPPAQWDGVYVAATK